MMFFNTILSCTCVRSVFVKNGTTRRKTATCLSLSKSRKSISSLWLQSHHAQTAVFQLEMRSVCPPFYCIVHSRWCHHTLVRYSRHAWLHIKSPTRTNLLFWQCPSSRLSLHCCCPSSSEQPVNTSSREVPLTVIGLLTFALWHHFVLQISCFGPRHILTPFVHICLHCRCFGFVPLISAKRKLSLTLSSSAV